MVEAIRVFVRYDIPDENNQTRRKRYEQFEEITPTLRVPESCRFIWQMYFDISESIRRVRDGVCEPIPPSEFVAWQTMTGEYIRPFIYNVLRAMDDQYCSELNKELSDYRERQRAEQEREAEKARNKR